MIIPTLLAPGELGIMRERYCCIAVSTQISNPGSVKFVYY
jgi:hypothetical protein